MVGEAGEARSRKAIISINKGKGEPPATEEVDLTKELTRQQYEAIVQQALNTHDQDAEDYFNKVKARMDRVGLRQPSTEVRFKDLYVETEVYADLTRNLPSVLGFYRGLVEYVLQKAYILRPDKRKLVILDNMSGVLKPGKLTLLLGPPSSGKSTLLRALSGALEHSGLKVNGDVTYNGRQFSEFVPLRTAAYVEQNDTHIGEITVRETFDFAARCQGAGSKKAVLEELRKREKEMGIEPDWNVDALMKAETLEAMRTSITTEFVIRMLGLGICSDTLVGDALHRGVSGGQKKRVTTGEMIVGPKRILFMDEISTGLDSSTTYQIVKFLGDKTRTQQNTTLISLLQPAPESFNLFDDVLLIAEGHLIYHGPTTQAAAYFETLGFKCPERKGVADFLQEVTSKKDQGQYWFDQSQPYKIITPKQFSELFKKSKFGRDELTRLDEPYDPEGQQFDDAALVKTPYATTGKQMFMACWDRENILVSRNLALYGFRFLTTMTLGVITAFSFFRTRMQPNSVIEGNRYFSVVFFSLIMIMFDGTTEINLGVLRLPGFYKQRDNRFYPSWAFVFPTTVLRIPYSLVCAVVWTGVVYYVTGLAPEASRFFYFMLMLFSIHTMGISMFRAIAGLARDESIAITGGSFLFLVLLMLGGFLLAQGSIPGWWIWFYWGCNPLSYAQKGMAVNEFRAPRWQKETVPGGTQTVGDAVLAQRGLPTNGYNRWLGFCVLVFAWIIFNLLTWFFYKFLYALDKPTAVLPPSMQEQIAEEMEQKHKRKHGGHHSAKQLQPEIMPPRTDVLANPEAQLPSYQSSKQLTSRHSKTQKFLEGASYKGDVPKGTQTSGITNTYDKILHTGGDGIQGNAAYDTYQNILQSPQGVAVAFDSHNNLSDHEEIEAGQGQTAGNSGIHNPIHESIFVTQDGLLENDYARRDFDEDKSTPAELDRDLARVKGMRASGSMGSGKMNLAPVISQRASSRGMQGSEIIDKGMILPFNPLALTFSHINYYVPMPAEMDTTDPEKIGPKPADVDGTTMLQLLNDCSGVFQPGILTALVGSSGAGKTTLMDVLAGRKTAGSMTGDVRISGYPKEQKSFARISGYVEQFDIHSPFTTVGEALWISSRLRFDSTVDNATVKAFIEEIEHLVELEPLRKSLVGVPGKDGLSVEQRKRLTIAVELVANPSIIFMDEPTSGLDARAAAIVMRTVRNTVDTGRTVVCTIHQPSIDIFEAFDDLLLMKVGGQIIYHGPLGVRSRQLVEYFEELPGVPKLKEGLNPATWMLQISTPGMEKMIGIDFAEAYATSETFRTVRQSIEKLEVPPEGSKALHFKSQYAQSQYMQFWELLKRNFISYSRDTAYNGTRFIFGVILAVLFGSILWQIGEQRSTVQDVGNILGALYLAMLFLAFINSLSVQKPIEYERTVSYRETAAGMYSNMPFALAACSVEIPYILLQSSLFSVISYWMIGFEKTAAKFFWYELMIFLTLFLMTNYGIMSVYATPSLVAASISSSMFFGVWNLYAGFIIPPAYMPPWFKWYRYLNPIYWSLYGIITTQLGDVQQLTSLGPGTTPISVQDYLNQSFDYKHDFIGWVALILIGYGLAFAAIAVLALQILRYQKR